MQTTGTIGYAAMFEQVHTTDQLRWSKTAEEQTVREWPGGDHVMPRICWPEKG